MPADQSEVVMRECRFLSLIVMAFGLTLGCDDRGSSSFVPIEPAEPAATRPAKPTTQELVSGQPKRIALKSIPFWISVPSGWQLKSQGGVMILQGPTPSGVAQLQIGRHLAPIASHVENLIAGAQREADGKAGPYTLAEVSETNGMKALEKRSVGSTRPVPAIDAAGNTIAQTYTSMDWKKSVFVPDGRDTVVCEIHFIDLSREQYDLDKEVLSKIMASLQYDPRASND
jgi:hypothetical protein